MIASIRGKKPHVYRVIILKQMADYKFGASYMRTFCDRIYHMLVCNAYIWVFLCAYICVCKKMVIYLGIKRKYTWQKNARISCSRNDCKYTWEKTARISCHNFETNGRPYCDTVVWIQPWTRNEKIGSKWVQTRMFGRQTLEFWEDARQMWAHRSLWKNWPKPETADQNSLASRLAMTWFVFAKRNIHRKY